MRYIHFNIRWSRWIVGLVFDYEPGDHAAWLHLGPLCIGFHRPGYYELDESDVLPAAPKEEVK